MQLPAPGGAPLLPEIRLSTLPHAFQHDMGCLGNICPKLSPCCHLAWACKPNHSMTCWWVRFGDTWSRSAGLNLGLEVAACILSGFWVHSVPHMTKDWDRMWSKLNHSRLVFGGGGTGLGGAGAQLSAAWHSVTSWTLRAGIAPMQRHVDSSPTEGLMIKSQIPCLSVRFCLADFFFLTSSADCKKQPCSWV